MSNESTAKITSGFSIMEKVRKYGYNHLLKQEQLQLALELIGFTGDNPGFNSLKELFDTSSAKLKKYFSDSQITKLKTIREISAEYLKEKITRQQTVFDNPEAVKNYLKLKIGNDSKEQFYCLFVDAKNQLIDCRNLSTGTVDQTVVYPREVIKEALEVNATALILAHNHPSGETCPSGSDIRLTESIKKAADAMDIKVLDHIIVGTGDYFSFIEEKIMETQKEYSIARSVRESFSGRREIVMHGCETTLPMSGSQNSKQSSSELFVNALNKLKENEKEILNRRISDILGSNRLKVDNLPNTLYILNKTYQNFLSEYKSSGYVDFEKNEKAAGFNGNMILRVLDKEVYSFFEKNYLSSGEYSKFSRLVPDPRVRQSIFAEYVHEKPINLSAYTKEDSTFIQKMLRKIASGINAILGRKHELEMLFEDFSNKRLRKVMCHGENHIINASELRNFTSLKGVHMIIGDADFSKTFFTDLGDVKEITGKAVFSNSRISSLANLQSTGSLDIRNSNVYDLGNLKKVRNNVFSNSFINFRKWENVEIGKNLFHNNLNMTPNYRRLRMLPSEKSIDGISRER